jgi:3D (Asp-Asp-Asp) domain-containing protein
MRKFLKRLTAFAICVFAALPANAASPQNFHQVKVTAYAAVPRCTKRVNPTITASEHRITPKDHYRLVALSPDLAKRYQFGDRFRLEIDGATYIVEYQDKMPVQHRKKIDFLLPSVSACFEFGKKVGKLQLIGRDK